MDKITLFSRSSRVVLRSKIVSRDSGRSIPRYNFFILADFKNHSGRTGLVCFCMLLLATTFPCHAGIQVNKSTSTIVVKSGAHLVIGNSISNFKGNLIKEDGAEISGKDIVFDNGTFEDSGKKIKITGKLDLENDNDIVLSGNKIFRGKRGELVQKIKVSGSNNRLEGVLQLMHDVELFDSAASVTCALTGRMTRNIKLNGGRVFLEEDLHFVDDVFFDGSGTVVLNKRNLHLGSTEMTCESPIYFDQAQDVELHANFHLAETWTFSSAGILEGNGNILYLDDNGEIVVEKGSSLLLKNLTVRGLKENKIRCLDENSTLSTQSITLIQDDNFSFTIGRLEVEGDLRITGTHTFAYQSAQESIVHSHAKLILDRGVTFSFDPMWNSSFSDSDWESARDFFVFEDETSQLVLKGATVHVTTTSMKLKKGTLRVKTKSYVRSELDGRFHFEEGLIIGNNNASDDLCCEIASGATLEVLQGALSYKNVSANSWAMMNERSTLFIGPGVALKLHQSIDVGSGIVSFADGSRLARARGKTLLGSVHTLGSIYYGRCYS